jgi:hypothetical protein
MVKKIFLIFLICGKKTRTKLNFSLFLNGKKLFNSWLNKTSNLNFLAPQNLCHLEPKKKIWTISKTQNWIIPMIHTYLPLHL